jgi:ABC-2 type transport system permease protein/sodium transport system permease protein
MPVNWTVQTLDGAVAAAAFSLASIVPLILILMTVTGAVYPAIDLTAGERERGTLEALIAAPVPRYQVLCAKYVAVLTVVLLTAIANLAAMTATAFSTGLEQALFGEQGLSVSLLAKLLGLLTVFAAFFSAVILTLTSIARSFKEAQAYLIPLMLVSLAPGVLALFPGLEMNALWAVTPLANMVLLARELFDHRVTPVLAVLTLASTLAYAGLALAIAARVFGTDAVLYGSAATWTDLLRRPDVPRNAPEWTLGVLSLAGILPAYVLLSGIPARVSGWTAADRLAANAVVLALLFAAWPAALCWQRRVSFRGAFQFTRPGVLSMIGAACLGASLWAFVYELMRLLSSERMSALAEKFPELMEELQSAPLGWKLVTLALVPAVCEELYFRGFLFQSLRNVLGPWATIGVTAAVFGLFHVSVGDAVVVERLLPTLLMGLMLGWVRHHSGSLWPGMLLHVVHNSALLTVDRWFPALHPDAATSTSASVGATVLAVAAVTAVAGAVLVPLRRSPTAAADVANV